VNKTKMNYWVDVAIAFASVMSALSGLVFLLPGGLASGVLGISYQAWNAAHTWSSLAVIAGVSAHLALHWKWMVAMTKQMLSATSREGEKEPTSELAFGGTQGRSLSRRAFLAVGATTAILTGAIVAGYRAVFDGSPVETSQNGDQLAATQGQQDGGVACPMGLVNDPYPGRCKHYRDSNGDGICDYSVAGSGSNQSASSTNSFGGGSSRHRPGFGQP